MLKKKIGTIIKNVERTCSKCGAMHSITPESEIIICLCGEKIYEESGLEKEDSSTEPEDSK